MRGFTAVEIVFMIFILVVVVLVVIQLVTRYVNPSTISPYIEDIEKNYKFLLYKKQCDDLCNEVKTARNEGERLFAAARWCSEKVTESGKNGIDIIEDGIYNDFYIVGGYPYCEDGTYCFLNQFTCDAGITLDIKECRKILCEYHYKILGDYDAATLAVRNVTLPGTCQVDKTKIPRGKILLKDSASWWYDIYFKNIDCRRILTE